MSNSIDKRIVEMQFDNQQFETNVRTSVSTLESLKKSLDLSGASKGFDELDKASGKVDMSALGSAVETVKSKFSALEVVATTALVRITNEAINTGKQLLSSLTVDQISAGWGKYAEKTSAVQTIMAATAKDFDDTGEQMEYVNGQLEKLNWFTDETSYSFLDMVQNIGKFTSNRIPLDQSVTAMQGISNWAAISGANVTEAGRAMYNLAQAIAVGRVQLIDWKSVENANMATAEFKETAIETALAMGTLEKGMDGVIRTVENGEEVSVSNFNAALTEGKWFTSDVLMSVLNQYGAFADELYKTTEKTGLTASELLSYIDEYEAGTLNLSEVAKKTGLSVNELETSFKALGGETMELGRRSFKAAQEAKTFKDALDSVKDAVSTGWMNTFELIFGNYQEAKVLWTDLANAMYDAFASSAEARNELLSGWRDLGGRDLLIDSFWNTWEAIGNVIGTIKGAFRDIFPPATAEQLYTATQKISEFTEKLKSISENSEGMDKLRRTFRGVASALDIVKTGLGWVWSGFKRLIGISSPVTGGILDLTAGLGDSIVRIRETVTNSESLRRVLSSLGDVIDSGRQIVIKAASAIFEKLKAVGRRIKEAIPFSQIGNSIADFTSRIPGFLKSMTGWVSRTYEQIRSSEALRKIWTKLKNTGVAVWEGISQIISNAWNHIKKFDIFGLFTEQTESAGRRLDNGRFAEIAFDVEESASKVGLAIQKVRNFFASSIEYIRSSETLRSIWTTVQEYFQGGIKTISTWGNRFWEAIKAFFAADVGGKVTIRDKLKTRFVAAFATLSDWLGEVKSDFEGKWQRIKDFFANFFSTTLPGFFSDLKTKVERALIRIKAVDWSNLIKTIRGVVGIVSLIRFMNTFATIGKSFKKVGKGFKDIGEAIGGLGTSLKDLAKNGLKITKLKKDSIGTTLLKIAASIGILVAAMLLLSKIDTGSILKSLAVIGALGLELSLISIAFKHGTVDGKSLLMMAGAITMMLVPILLLSKMDTGSALKGIVALGLIMTEMALFTRISKGGFSGKTGFLSMSISINLLVLAIKQLAGISTGGLLKGLSGLGLLFVELSLFAKSASGLKVTGLIGLAAALNLMVVAVKSLGSMELGSLAKGVAAIGGLLASFGLLFKMSGGVKLGNSIALLLMLAGTLILFTETFKQVDNLDSSAMLGFSGSVSAVLLSLATSLKLLSAIPMTGTLKGIANLGIAIAGVATILAGLGALQTVWSDLPGFITDGGDILGAIGSAIGKFFGGIAGGFVVGLDLPQIGTELSGFITNGQAFLDGVKDIGEDTKNGVKNLTDAMYAINGAEINTWWASFFSNGNSIEKFKTDLETLAAALVGYATGIAPLNEVSDDTLTRSIDVATSLADTLEKMPTSNVISDILGESRDMNAFSQDVITLGQVLVDFCVSVSALSGSTYSQPAVDTAIAAAKGLAQLESSLEGQGGIEDSWEGVKSLSTFGVRLNIFGDKLKLFIEDVSKIEYDPDNDGGKITNLIDIGTRLATLEKGLAPQKGYLQNMEGTKSLSVFSEGIPVFAEGLNSFITEIKTIVYDPENDGPMIDAVMNIATRLASLENTLKEHGGSIQDLMGDATLASLSKELPDFAMGINSFISIVSGIEGYDEDKVNTAIEIANKLGEFESSLSQTGGDWQAFWGEKDVALFSENIKLLGRALRSFATNVTSVDVGDTDKAIETMDMIQSFVDSLTASGGWLKALGTFFGGGATTENTFDELCSVLIQFGDTINTLGTTLAEVNVAGLLVKIGVAKIIFTNFQSLLDGLSDPSDSIKRFDKYGSAMDDMGTYLKTFSDNAVDCDISAITQAISAMSDLIALTNSAGSLDVSKADNIADMLNAYSGLDLSGVGHNLGKTLALAITSAVQDGTGNFTAAVTRLFLAGASAMNASRSHWTNGMRTLVSGIVQTFSAGTANFATASGNLSSAGLKAVVNTQTSWRNGAKTLGNAFVLALLSTLQDARVKMSSTAAALGNAGASSASATQNAWYSAGRNLGQGLANGVASMAGKVRSAAANAASGAVSAVKNAWKVHSPSRVGAELGMYFDYGLANGLTNYGRAVSDSASSVGEGAVESARLVLAGLSSGMLDDIDPNPTIRPVLDLSNVESGVSRIDGLFGAKRSVDTSLFNSTNSFRNVRALNFDGARIAGAQGNKEVVAELQQLTQRFNHLAEAVSNMQLVLDTGTLVGATSAKMDTQLGTLASRRGRGN